MIEGSVRMRELRVLPGLAAAAALVVAGCATQQVAGGSGAYVSPIQAQADDFKVTVAQGAIAGALVGGVIGAITSGGDMRRVAAGAIAGGAVGAVGGYMIAGQKQAYANREQALEGLMADARQRNEKLTRVLATTDQVIARRKQELAQLKSAKVAVAEKAKMQRQLLSELEADQKAIDQAVVTAREHGSQMDQNIVQLRQQFPDAGMRPLDDMSVGFHRTKKDLERRPDDIKQIMSEAAQVKVAA